LIILSLQIRMLCLRLTYVTYVILYVGTCAHIYISQLRPDSLLQLNITFKTPGNVIVKEAKAKEIKQLL
jgi:hypothetical protein